MSTPEMKIKQATEVITTLRDALAGETARADALQTEKAAGELHCGAVLDAMQSAGILAPENRAKVASNFSFETVAGELVTQVKKASGLDVKPTGAPAVIPGGAGDTTKAAADGLNETNERYLAGLGLG
jgi:hypothetical protein